MKINWKVRMLNPYFWLGIFGVMMTAMGVSPDMFTSWEMVMEQGKELIRNPYLLGSMVVSIAGILNDPTTKGMKDSKRALSYTKPKNEMDK